MRRAAPARRSGGRPARRPEFALLAGAPGVYLVGALAGVTAVGLVLLAEAIARGVASLAAGDDAWRDALMLGVAAALVPAGAACATQVVPARPAIGAQGRERAQLAGALLGGNPRAGSAATLATRELDALDDFFLRVLPALASVAVIPLVIGARILFADWVSALVIVVTVPLIPVFMILVGQYTKERTEAATVALARLSDHVVELARGLPVLVGLGRVDEQSAALDRISDDYRRTTLITLRTAFLSALVLELIATISVAVVAVFIGVRMLDGQLGLATGLLVLILAPECYQPFRDLGVAFHASRAGTAALATAQAAIDAPARADLRVAGQPARAGVEVTHLTIAFEGRDPVVSDLAFTLPAQGITALVGASGAGKSSVLRALAGRLDADASGRIAGVDPALLAWAPQHPHTVGSTVREELSLYSVNEFAVEWMLARLGLLGVAEADPSRLSPGELRRVAVARAMLRVDDGATVLLLDEPTAHLDDQSAAAVVALIRWAGERASVLVASHDAAVTALATRFVELGGASVAARAGRGRSSFEASGDPAEGATTWDERPRRGDVRAALVAFIRPAWGRYLAAVALGTLAAAFAIALTAVSGWLIVRASELPAIMYLLVAIVGVRFFGLGRAVLRYCERLVTHDAVFASTTSLRHRLWASLAARGASSRVLQRGGTALDYLVGAADDVRDLVPRIVVPTAVGVVVSTLALLTTWIILPAATGVMALVVLGGAIIAPSVALLADRAAEADRLRTRSGMLRRFAAALDAADDLRANGADALVRAEVASLDADAGRASRRIALSRGLGAAIVIFSACAGAMGMLAASAGSTIPVALAAVLVLLPVALIDPLLGMLGGLAHAPALSSALDHVGELDDEQVARSGAADRGAPGPGAEVDALTLDGLAVAWPGGDDVFRGLSATVTRGEWLVVEGPSGSGKSTLLTALLGSLPPTMGRVLINGRDAAQLDLRGTVAWCPQESHLFDSTWRANLLLGRPREDRPSDDELVEAIRAAGLGPAFDALPDGLDSRIGSQGAHLSGGERQRLAVARTLLSRAGVVLLDEPTAHLDEQTAHELMADVRAALADRIVVLVTHHADDRRPGDARLTLGRTPHRTTID